MDSLVITPRNKSELERVSTFLNQIGLKSLRLSNEEKEDIGLAHLMSEADRTKTIPLDEFKKSLGQK